MIREIAEKYNVILNEVELGDKFCDANGEESYINSSYSAGSIRTTCDAEIWLGIYENEELKLISFFHEMGHMLIDMGYDNDLKVYDYEKDAWEKGYKLAGECGVKFSRKAKRWAKKQLNSYKNYEEREYTSFETTII